MASYTTGQAGGQVLPLSNIPAEYTADALELARAQRMAQMLSSAPVPEGQMISGRYVAPSWTQSLAQLANAATGAYFGNQAEEKQLKLAEKLRQDKLMTQESIMTALDKGDTKKALAIATSRPEYSKEFIAPLMANVIPKATGPRAPLQIDTGTHIELRDAIDPTKVLQRIPKAQMPTAGQVVETKDGPVLVNTRTGQGQAITVDGKPLEPKLTSEQNKDILSINQQRETIRGALKDVEANKNAFSFGRGLAQNVPFGESIAGRFETPAQTQTRAYVFNNVSAVIKERAGTAQSAQELQRINSFMPAVTDNADQMINKLKGFDKYLDDLEKGTRQSTSKTVGPIASATPKVFSTQADLDKAIKEKKVEKGDKVTVNGVTGTIQ